MEYQEGEESVAWIWNGKGETTKNATCPHWVACQLTLEGGITVLLQGRGEEIKIFAGVFRVMRHIPGSDGFIPQTW